MNDENLQILRGSVADIIGKIGEKHFTSQKEVEDAVREQLGATPPAVAEIGAMMKALQALGKQREAPSPAPQDPQEAKALKKPAQQKVGPSKL